MIFEYHGFRKLVHFRSSLIKGHCRSDAGRSSLKKGHFRSVHRRYTTRLKPPKRACRSRPAHSPLNRSQSRRPRASPLPVHYSFPRYYNQNPARAAAEEREKGSRALHAMAQYGGQGKGPGYPQYAASYGTSAAHEERRWWPWLVPTVLVACVAVFAAEMFVNDCPRHGSPLGGDATCVAAGFLHRFAFQPIRENPLLGPSSATYVSFSRSASGSAQLLGSMRNWGLEMGDFFVGFVLVLVDVGLVLVGWLDFKRH
jgi:hypothetical protein